MKRLILFFSLCIVFLNAVAKVHPYFHPYKLKKWGITPANYSGITPIGEGLYAVVSDEEDEAGFYVWEIQIDSTTGKLISVQQQGWRGTGYPIDRDAEGIAFCPPRQSVFISGEADQQILEHRLDGNLTGNELRIPDSMTKNNIMSNRGFEALGYDEKRQLFWTTTESNLRKDSTLQLRLQSIGLDLQPRQEIPYKLNPTQSKRKGRDHYHGVVAVTPLQDSTLLILEREAYIAKKYNGSRCWCSLFRFNTMTREKILLNEWKTRFTATNTRFANYEGMCLGPILTDGRQTILLVSDSQAGYGRGPWHLKDWLKIIILNF
ncbi:MAG: esterase-like activity of phytase family protein [Bacteroidaceae bacterium]|nr:esterase-like activity of phytase family protein [Bacteroidaceae bacterium]